MHCRLAISILALSAASLVSAAPLASRDHSSIISTGHHVTSSTQQPEVIPQPAAAINVVSEAINSAGGQTDTISSIVNNLAHILSLTSSSSSSSVEESAESSSLKPRRRSIKRRHFHP